MKNGNLIRSRLASRNCIETHESRRAGASKIAQVDQDLLSHGLHICHLSGAALTCEPYSIAIFERAGTVNGSGFKRIGIRTIALRHSIDAKTGYVRSGNQLLHGLAGQSRISLVRSLVGQRSY
ncbi:MAG: hypothetical protein EOS85_15870 [Mesorhizobium sp.]|nr:MAG: hypothetical protein EOS85_15870 [Mesorhizobium sp.]